MRRILLTEYLLLASILLAACVFEGGATRRQQTISEDEIGFRLDFQDAREEVRSIPFHREVIALTNSYRQASSLGELAFNGELREAAKVHAKDKASLSGHTGSDNSSVGDRAKRTGYAWRTIAENIFLSTFEPTAEQAVQGWKDSPGHNANLLHPSITETGVFRFRHDNGWWSVVAVYARPNQ